MRRESGAERVNPYDQWRRAVLSREWKSAMAVLGSLAIKRTCGNDIPGSSRRVRQGTICYLPTKKLQLAERWLGAGVKARQSTLQN